ncbi:MAG: virulence-associated E family protein [Pseudomonadota bacterium]
MTCNERQINTAIRMSGVRYDGPVGKRIEKAFDGAGLKKTQLLDQRKEIGEILNLAFTTAGDLFKYRLNADACSMFFAGTFAPNATEQLVIPQSQVAQLIAFDPAWDGRICAATKGNLAFREGPACVLIDVDHPKHEEIFPVRPPLLECADDVRAALLKLLPEAAGAPMLIYPSSSSMIADEHGTMLSGPGGWRVILVVSDGREIPFILEALHLRAWARQFWAYAFVAKGNGAVLFRSIADQALGRPTQPDYPKADLGPGLHRQPDTFKVYNVDGAFLKSGSVTLSEEERATAERSMMEAKRKLRELSGKAVMLATALHSKSQQDRGVPSEMADRAAAALVGKSLLLGTAQVEFDDGTSVQVAELMGPRGADYDGRQCPDPLEPDYDGGRSVGKFFWNEGKRPGIYSFARGGRYVAFRHDYPSLMKALSDSLARKDEIVSAIASSELTEVEQDQALALAARTLRLGNNRKSLRTEINAERLRLGIGETNETENSESFDFPLPENERIPRRAFPFKRHSMTGDAVLIDHKDNVACLLEGYGIEPSYNEITKQIEWADGGSDVVGDNSENARVSKILSLASLNDLPSKNLPTHLIGLAETRPTNPVTDYLKKLEWDGVPRISTLADRMKTSDVAVSRAAFRIFFCQACAAGDHAVQAQCIDPSIRAHFESVVVFVGAQGAGKTKGLRRLLPTALRKYFKEGVALDPRDKDSVKKSISAWIVELGELDATFRKADIAQLKAFLSSDTDEIRMPYAPNASKFKRRTVFVGTVNDPSFLADATGNRRFIPLEIESLMVALSGVDIDQLWAEAWCSYANGEKWWPTDQESAALDAHTDRFRARSWIEDKIASVFDATADLTTKPKRLSATDIFDLLSRDQQGRSAPPTQKDLKDVARSVRRFWESHPNVKRMHGELFLHVEGQEVPVHQPGGKNNGWLLPPRAKRTEPGPIRRIGLK